MNDRMHQESGRRAAIVELLLSAAIVEGFAAGFVPVSEVPFLVVLGWLSLRRRKLRWASVGLTRPAARSRAALLVLAGVLYAIVSLYALDPLIDRISGPADMSEFAEVRGNADMLAFWIGLSWLLGAFGEELGYRGYLMNRITDVVGDDASGWSVAVLASSALFGLSHISQGASGMISNFLGALVYAGLYLLAGRNLWVPILAHGFEDTIGFVLIFLGKYPRL
jgi:CAAX protease family protein